MTSRRATFFGAALMARSMDAGATVGMVLLALEVSDGTAHATLVGGLLGACLTLPHVAGPAAARVLSRFADVRVGILVFTLWYASCLVAAALGLGTLPLPGIAALLLCGGLAGPVLTGGLSSLVSANGAARRASSSLDALVYGLSGTLAPVAVSAVAVLATPRTAVVTLAVAGAAGGAMVLSLPRPDSRPAEGDRHDARHVLAFIAGNRADALGDGPDLARGVRHRGSHPDRDQRRRQPRRSSRWTRRRRLRPRRTRGGLPPHRPPAPTGRAGGTGHHQHPARALLRPDGHPARHRAADRGVRAPRARERTPERLQSRGTRRAATTAPPPGRLRHRRRQQGRVLLPRHGDRGCDGHRRHTLRLRRPRGGGDRDPAPAGRHGKRSPPELRRGHRRRRGPSRTVTPPRRRAGRPPGPRWDGRPAPRRSSG